MWMYTLLPKVLNMSLTAGIVIIIVLLARIPLKKAPKIFSYMLWAVVLFRLVCPVSFSSGLSLVGLFQTPAASNGSIDYIPSDIVHTEYPQVALPVPGLNEIINESLPQGEEQLAADPLELPMAAATMLWLCGIAAMLIYSGISLFSLRRRLVGAVCLHKTTQLSAVSSDAGSHANGERSIGYLYNRTGKSDRNALTYENVYLADHIPTPFVIGLIHPRIFVPSTLSEQELSYVILHEQTHIRRLDHIVKMIAFLVLAVHWFNPLVWAAFLVCMKDMEMSCDERVLKEMGDRIKADYSATLLSLSTGRRLINGSPLAFGEGNIKGRIKNVLNFKKPTVWVTAVSIVLVVSLTIGLAANKADVVARNDIPEDVGHGEMAAGTQSGTWEGMRLPAGIPTETQEDAKAEVVDITQPGPDEENVTKIVLSSPKLSPLQNVGVDMAKLDYASEDIVIFHGYFGLFVYDLNSGSIVRSLDLQPIGCSATQGDDYCEVTVSADGSTVQLHPMSSKSMYVYSVSDNSLRKTAYRPMENRFADYADIVDIVGLEKAGSYSHTAVKFNTGGYGYLYTTDWTLATLSYVRNGMEYKLFDFSTFSPTDSSFSEYDLNENISNDIEQSISNAILNHYVVDKSGLRYDTAGEGHITFETEDRDGHTYAYIWERYARFVIEDGSITEVSGHSSPAVIVFEKDSQGNYIFSELIRPNDGKGYRESLERIFSVSALKKLDKADRAKIDEALGNQLEAHVRAYLRRIGREEDIHIELR